MLVIRLNSARCISNMTFADPCSYKLSSLVGNLHIYETLSILQYVRILYGYLKKAYISTVLA